MRSHLFLCAILVGCGGSTSADGGADVADVGADGTADGAKVDSGIDSASADVRSGDALITEDAPRDAACTDCLGSTLSWGYEGGLVAYVDSSSITPCRTYEHRRSPVRTDPADQTCKQDLGACGSGDTPDVGDVERALGDPEMASAFAKAPVLYGRDTRPSDGSIFVVTYGGKSVQIGVDCGAVSACTPIPDGVKRAMEALQRLDTAQLGIGACKTVFGGV